MFSMHTIEFWTLKSRIDINVSFVIEFVNFSFHFTIRAEPYEYINKSANEWETDGGWASNRCIVGCLCVYVSECQTGIYLIENLIDSIYDVCRREQISSSRQNFQTRLLDQNDYDQSWESVLPMLKLCGHSFCWKYKESLWKRLKAVFRKFFFAFGSRHDDGVICWWVGSMRLSEQFSSVFFSSVSLCRVFLFFSNRVLPNKNPKHCANCWWPKIILKIIQDISGHSNMCLEVSLPTMIRFPTRIIDYIIQVERTQIGRATRIFIKI